MEAEAEQAGFSKAKAVFAERTMDSRLRIENWTILSRVIEVKNAYVVRVEIWFFRKRVKQFRKHFYSYNSCNERPTPWKWCSRGQAMKSAGWMPWHQEPTKDVTSCDKLWGVANTLWSTDFRMGKPGWCRDQSTYGESNSHRWGTRWTETSK